MAPVEEDLMLDLVELSHPVETRAPHRDKSGIHKDSGDTRVVSTAIFYPVYASPDDVDFQREERFEPQFLPR